MDIHTAAKYMEQGYRIKRDSDPDMLYLYYKDDALWICYNFVGHLPAHILIEDLLATDWELITDNIISYFPITYDK